MSVHEQMLTSLDNFARALASLDRFLADTATTERERAGVLQAFEYTYELCWKAAQKLAAYQGLVASSPRQAFKAAFRIGVIDQADEDVWLDMIDDRNRTVHTYRAEIAQEIFVRVRDRYHGAFTGFLARARALSNEGEER